jgi:hypothetical protein
MPPFHPCKERLLRNVHSSSEGIDRQTIGSSLVLITRKISPEKKIENQKLINQVIFLGLPSPEVRPKQIKIVKFLC